MNLFSISGLLIGVLCAALGVLTLFRGKKSIHYIWVLFSFSVALWGLGSYRVGIANNSDAALWWWRIGYVGVILIPIFLTHFVIAFLELKKQLTIFSVYILGIFFLIANFYDGLFIKDVHFLFNQFYYLSSPPILYTAFIFLFFVLVAYDHAKLFQAYKNSTGIKRNQIKYFLLATAPGFLAGAFEFLPVYKIEIYPYFHFIIALSPLTVTYAILKYRLMDIRIVIRKAITYLLSSGFAYAVFFFLVWASERYLGGVFASVTYVVGLMVAPLFVIALLRFYSTIRITANKYLFFDLSTSQEAITKLTDELTNFIDFSKIVDSIVDIIKNAMQLDRAGILSIDQDGQTTKYKIAKVIGFNENNGISLVQDNFLTQYLEKTQKPLVRDELQMRARDSKIMSDRQNFNQLAENMKHIEASICLPMIFSNRLIGIIVLGSKISGDAYSSEDLNLLNTLSKQAAIAINNAMLYKEVQDFNKTLQQKVDEQTKDIQQAYEVEKRAHNELKSINDAKSQFMAITQHHLRTPLSSTMGYIDLLLTNTFGKMPKKAIAVLEKVKSATQGEIRIVNDLLDISAFQMGKNVLQIEDGVDLDQMIKEIFNNYSIEIKEKGLYFKVDAQGDIPLILADKSKLTAALTNIIDNAVKYTKEGGITTTLKSENGKVLILIKDTGMGISKECLGKLFSSTFERCSDAQKAFAVGKGIGLFLSSKVVELHGGKIWAESDGAGKGSVFCIELPIKNVK